MTHQPGPVLRERAPVTFDPLKTNGHEYLADQIYQDLRIDDASPIHPAVTPIARYDVA